MTTEEKKESYEHPWASKEIIKRIVQDHKERGDNTMEKTKDCAAIAEELKAELEAKGAPEHLIELADALVEDIKEEYEEGELDGEEPSEEETNDGEVEEEEQKDMNEEDGPLEKFAKEEVEKKTGKPMIRIAIHAKK